MLSKASSTSFRVSLQRHLIIQHINFDCFDSRSSAPSCHLHQIRCGRFASLRTVFSKTFPKVCNCFRRATTQKSSTMTQSFEISVVTAKESGARGSDLSWKLSFNTCDHVSHQIDAASSVFIHIPAKSWPTCPSVRVLQEDMCKSTCELHRGSALAARPPRLPSQTGRLRGFPSSCPCPSLWDTPVQPHEPSVHQRPTSSLASGRGFSTSG